MCFSILDCIGCCLDTSILDCIGYSEGVIQSTPSSHGRGQKGEEKGVRRVSIYHPTEWTLSYATFVPSSTASNQWFFLSLW